MRRLLAALLLALALGIMATLDSRSVARVTASWRDAVVSRVSTPRSLASLHRFEASGFLTRHTLVQQFRTGPENDTTVVGYWLMNHRLRTRQKLVLTIVGQDRVVRAEFGFASPLLSGDKGAEMRALLSDFLGTFTPSADSAKVAPLRAQIEAKADQGSLPTDAYLTLLGRSDTISAQYQASQLWIDHAVAGRDTATLIRLSVPGAPPTRVLAVDWVSSPDVLGGTVADLWTTLTQTDIARTAGVPAGDTIRYRVTHQHHDLALTALFHSADSLCELSIVLSKPTDESGQSLADASDDFLFLAALVAPMVDRSAVTAMQFVTSGGRTRKSDTPDWQHIADALTAKRGPVVMNFSESSFRFDQLAGGLPRMTLGPRGRFGAATDSVSH